MKIGSLDRTAVFCWSPTSYPPLLALGTASGAMDASFSATTELEIFELDNAFKKRGTLPANARFNSLSWSAAGIIAGGKENGELDIYDPRAIMEKLNNETMARHAMFSGPVKGLDFSSVNPSLLAAGGPEGEVYIFDLKSGAKPYRPSSKPTRAEDISFLSWNHVADYILAVGSNSGATGVYDLRGKREIMKLAYPGGRRKVTGISWHPSTPTRLVTVNDDDNSPVVLIWDLRNASAPELTLNGHEKGILSVQWCKMDPDLVISTSKDNRALLWDVSVGGPIGELCQSRNWTFDAKWCPRNPDMIAVSSFDGTVSIHSIQGQGIIPFEYESNLTPEISKLKPDPNDIFSMIGRKPSSAITLDALGGLVLERPPKWLRRPNGVSWAFGGKLVSFSGKKSMISIPTIDSAIISRVDMLDSIVRSDDPEQFKNFCDIMANTESDSFNDQDRETWGFLKVMFEKSREHMHEFLGLITDSRMAQQLSKVEQKLENLRLKESNSLPSESASFQLYVPEKGEEAEADNVITRLCVVGDFDKAVDACIANNRWADALVIAVSGGPDLLKRTQKEYFNSRRKEKTYIKLLEAVVDSNFDDFVQNVQFDVTKNEWKDLLGFISTFATSDELSRQFSLLGTRLSEQCTSTDSVEVQAKRKFFYHAAALSYIGAGDLDNAVRLWIRREHEEESTLLRKDHAPSRLVSHFVALQSLIEKITVLRKAINYFDPNLSQASDQTNVYSLQALYDRVLEYSEILSVFGRPAFAWKNLQLVPEALYSKDLAEGDIDPIAAMRDRLYHSLGVSDKNVTCPFSVAQIVSKEETAELEAKTAVKAPKSLPQTRVPQYSQQTGSYPAPGYQPAYPSYPPTQNTPYYPTYPQAGTYPGGGYTPPPLAPYAAPDPRPSGPGIFHPPPMSAPSVLNPPHATAKNIRPWVPPAVVKPVAPPVFTPPHIGLPRSSRNSFTEAEPGPPPVNNNAGSFNQGPPPIIQGPSMMNNRPVVNQGPPAMSTPPVMSPPTMNQRAPANQAPPVMSAPSINQRPTFNQGPPVMNGRPMNQGPPVMSGPPMNQRPPVMPGPPMNQGPPPMNQRPPVMSGPPMNQGPPVMSGPPMNQGPPPMNQGPPFNSVPPMNQRPPVDQVPSVMPGPPTMNQGQSLLNPVNEGTQKSQMPAFNQGPPLNAGPLNNQANTSNTNSHMVSELKDQTSTSMSEKAQFASEPSKLISAYENHLSLLKRNGDMSQKRMIEDAERRLKSLYDQLRSNQLPEDIVSALIEILGALEGKDFNRSTQIQIDLMTRRFDKTGSWIMGIKRVIDCTEKLHKQQGH